MPALISLPDKAVDAGLRAEVVNHGDKGLDSTIQLVQPVGPFTYVTVDWKGGSVTARVNGVSHMKPKEAIKVDINPEGLLFFDRTSEKRLDLL